MTFTPKDSVLFGKRLFDVEANVRGKLRVSTGN